MIALYDKWMRVFGFAHDEFWCQDDRYSPESLSTQEITTCLAGNKEPRLRADLAARKLNNNVNILDLGKETSHIYLEKLKQDLGNPEATNGSSVYVKWKLVSIGKTQNAVWSEDQKMVYIPCKIAAENGNAAPTQTTTFRFDCNPGFTLVPLASLLHQHKSRQKLINVLFHQRQKTPLAKSLVGSFEISKRDIISQIAPSKLPVEVPDVVANTVTETAAQYAESRFHHSATPSWLKWEFKFKRPLIKSTDWSNMLNFAEHDELVHGRGCSLIRYGLDKAKYTAVFEAMRGLG